MSNLLQISGANSFPVKIHFATYFMAAATVFARLGDESCSKFLSTPRRVGISKVRRNSSANPVPVKSPFATYFRAAATVPARAVLDTPRWVAFSRA
jgi:hypothetical protein